MKFRIPLEQHDAGPIARDRPRIRLRVRSQYGDYLPIPFVVDTGADLTSIPVALARREGIPFRRDVEVSTGGLVGRTTSFRSPLHVAVGAWEYDWPCYFVNTPPGGRDSTAVLGRAGFLEAFDFCIHGDALTLTRRGSFPYWLDRICTLLSLPFVRARSSEEPL